MRENARRRDRDRARARSTEVRPHSPGRDPAAVGDMSASTKNASYYSRSSALSESLQALLAAAVATATDADQGAARLNSCAARFDTVAAALEQDLLTLARASQPRPKPLPLQLLRTLAEREEAAASGRR